MLLGVLARALRVTSRERKRGTALWAQNQAVAPGHSCMWRRSLHVKGTRGNLWCPVRARVAALSPARPTRHQHSGGRGRGQHCPGSAQPPSLDRGPAAHGAGAHARARQDHGQLLLLGGASPHTRSRHSPSGSVLRSGSLAVRTAGRYRSPRPRLVTFHTSNGCERAHTELRQLV